MIDRALAKHARRAFDVRRDYRRKVRIRSRRHRVGRSENNDRPSADRRGEMRQPHVVRDEQVNLGEDCRDAREIGRAGQIDRLVFRQR